jgi:hypothetical protein
VIKASEIRIGNIIWDDTRQKIKYVTHRVISDLAGCAEPLAYSPIPITPEWLERCGFVNEGKNVFVKDRFKIGAPDHGGVNWVFYDDRHLSTPGLEHVHQLQNLYHALTGEELNFPITYIPL